MICVLNTPTYLPLSLFRQFIRARRGSGKRPPVCCYVRGRLELGGDFPLYNIHNELDLWIIAVLQDAEYANEKLVRRMSLVRSAIPPCLMLVREVAEGLAVEADENYTIALDLKITPELRQSCIARELVNRIQNRRKEMDLQITDRIRIALRGLGGDLQAAVEKHKAYILEEVQGVEIGFGSAPPTGGEWVRVSVEGFEVEVCINQCSV